MAAKDPVQKFLRAILDPRGADSDLSARCRILLTGGMSPDVWLDDVRDPALNPLRHFAALNLAAYAGRTELCRTLLDAGADKSELSSVLEAAALGGHMETAKLLLAPPYDRDAQPYDGAFLAAGRRGHLPVLRHIWEMELFSIERKYGLLNKGLMEAAAGGHTDTCGYLIDQGANVNILYDEGTETPLHAAASHGRLEVCELLIAAGAPLDARGRTKLRGVPDGPSPLEAAALCDQEAACRLLVGHGAKPAPGSDPKRNLSNIAAKNGNASLLRFFIGQGVPLDPSGFPEANPVYSLLERGQAEAAEILLDSLSDAKRTEVINDCMFMGAFRGRSDICRFGLERGAPTDISDSYGETALHHGARIGNLEICAMLVAAGANVNAVSENRLNRIPDQTPLTFAAASNHEEVCRFLLDHGARLSPGRKNPAASCTPQA